MSEAIKFWLAKELVSIAVFIAVLFVVGVVAWFLPPTRRDRR